VKHLQTKVEENMKSHRFITGLAIAICIVGIAIFAYGIFILSVIGHPYDPVMSMAWENVRIIQAALDHYSTDHDGVYPENIDDLLSMGYLYKFPIYYQSGPERRTMRNIPYSEDSGTWGDFSYWTQKVDGKVTKYFLCVYGDRKTFRNGKAKNRIDIDGDGKRENVILFVSEPEFQQSEQPLQID
jgi:hypothetical protein